MDVISNINNYSIYNGDCTNTSQGEGDNSSKFNVSEIAAQPAQAVGTASNDNLKEDNKYSKKDLDDALNKVNNFLKDEKTHAEYSIHKDFGTLMVKIVDDKSKEVIMELPPEKILDMIASMCKQFGLLDKKA